MPDLRTLFLDPKFWFAVYALVQIVALSLFPQITVDQWKIVDGIVAALVALITGTKAAVVRELAARNVFIK